MFSKLRRIVTLLPIAAIVFATVQPLLSQNSVSAEIANRLSLTEVVRNFPDYVAAKDDWAYIDLLSNRTAAERDAALPLLFRWLKDDRPEVRRLVLNALSLIYLPGEPQGQPLHLESLPPQYLPALTQCLRDPDPVNRTLTFSALQPTGETGVGLPQLANLLLPFLREPEILTEYPDSRWHPVVEPMNDKQREELPKLAVLGPLLLAILAAPRLAPTSAVDDAIVEFLNREDQTKSTLGECLHMLALNQASERVNDEALRRIFGKESDDGFSPAVRGAHALDRRPAYN